MGVLSKIRNSIFRTDIEGVQQRETYVGYASGDWAYRLLPQPSASGVSVTPEIAIGIATVYACIAKISATIAQLPVELIDTNGGKFTKIKDNRTYLLNISPDNNENAFKSRELMYAGMLLFGGSMYEIERDRRTGEAIKLRRVERTVEHPEKMVAKDGQTLWKLKHGNEYRYVFGRDMVVFEYLFGRGPGQVSKETIGILKAAQDYAVKFFAGGGVMDGLLTSEQNLKGTQINEFVETWEKQRGKQTRMLPFGLKYQRLGVEPDKAQNTASREYQSKEVCQIFGIDPRMIGIIDGSAYKSTEEASNHYAVHTITPLVNRLESELNFKLLFEGERQNLYFRHNMDELVRGDMKTRAEVQDMQLKNGTRNINEVRSTDLLNEIEGGGVHLAQVNQIDIKEMSKYSKKIASTADAGNN